MAWNRPNLNRTGKVNPKKRIGLHLAISISFCLIAIIVLSLYLTKDSGVQEVEEAKRHNIKTVNPTIPKESAQSSSTENNNIGSGKTKKEYKTYRDSRGILRYEGGARVPNPDDFKNPMVNESRSILPKFSHVVEEEIASLLVAKPGNVVAGMVRYDGYEQDFINSLVDKIEITDEDTPKQKEIKLGVIECKKELAERVKAGEKIVDILKESRAELRRMADYKYEINEILHEQVRDCNCSDDDIRLAYEAANKMLAEKGIGPLRVNSILIQRHRVLTRIKKNNETTQGEP